MLSFRSTGIFFILAAGAIIVFHFTHGLSLWWLLAPVLLFKILIIYGSANISSGFYIKAYCEGNTNEKKIAITFDDGPHPVYTPRVLEILAEYQVPAAFFLIGKNIAGNEDIVKQMDAAGHIIGNHTFSHSFFIDFKTAAGFREELNSASEAVFRITGKKMNYFRPPYGVTTPNLASASRSLDYQLIGWNIRSLDTTSDTEQIVAERVKKQVKPGAIILFHDTSAKTLGVLRQTINFARENGFKIVNLEELLKIPAYK